MGTRGEKGRLQNPQNCVNKEKAACLCACFWNFWRLSKSEWVSVRCPGETGSKFWFWNICEKVKLVLNNQSYLQNAMYHFLGSHCIFYILVPSNIIFWLGEWVVKGFATTSSAVGGQVEVHWSLEQSDLDYWKLPHFIYIVLPPRNERKSFVSNSTRRFWRQ